MFAGLGATEAASAKNEGRLHEVDVQRAEGSRRPACGRTSFSGPAQTSRETSGLAGSFHWTIVAIALENLNAVATVTAPYRTIAGPWI